VGSDVVHGTHEVRVPVVIGLDKLVRVIAGVSVLVDTRGHIRTDVLNARSVLDVEVESIQVLNPSLSTRGGLSLGEDGDVELVVSDDGEPVAEQVLFEGEDAVDEGQHLTVTGVIASLCGIELGRMETGRARRLRAGALADPDASAGIASVDEEEQAMTRGDEGMTERGENLGHDALDGGKGRRVSVGPERVRVAGELVERGSKDVQLGEEVGHPIGEAKEFEDVSLEPRWVLLARLGIEAEQRPVAQLAEISGVGLDTAVADAGAQDVKDGTVWETLEPRKVETLGTQRVEEATRIRDVLALCVGADDAVVEEETEPPADVAEEQRIEEAVQCVGRIAIALLHDKREGRTAGRLEAGLVHVSGLDAHLLVHALEVVLAAVFETSKVFADAAHVGDGRGLFAGIGVAFAQVNDKARICPVRPPWAR
jgi:hypothetical protein